MPNDERNIMLITKEWLKSKSACHDGYEWSLKQEDIDKGIEVEKFLKLLTDDDKWPWANWVIVRVMKRPQYLAYAIYSAEQVIDIYEKKHPGNKAPREAIEAAKTVLKDDTQENHNIAFNKRCAVAAAAVAYVAAAVVVVDVAAAYAYAAYVAAAVVVAAAAYAAYADARLKMRKKILAYGIKLIEWNKFDKCMDKYLEKR